MTGTPIRNTMLHLYVMQRLLQPEILHDAGIHCFDAWASMFGRIRSSAEITTSGTIERKNRFAEFVNIPELLQMFLSVADIIFGDDVDDGSLQRPVIKYVPVQAPMSDVQIEIMKDLVERSNLIRANEPRTYYKFDRDGLPQFDPETRAHKKKTDNLLWVSGDGRKACLDPRLIDPTYGAFYKSKVYICARRVFKLWRRTQNARATQLIFLDLSTPKSDGSFSVYDEMKRYLIELGMPEGEIAFIQDYQKDEDKAALFKAVNAGEVRVVFGSTETLGVGVDVQEKLLALHHLDCPWRPCDLEQREGRIKRSGNRYSRVLVYRYVTQGAGGNTGFDAFMWQLVEAKYRFIRQILRGDMTVRRIEEDASDNPIFSAGQIKALATGDDRIMRHVEIEAELEDAIRLQRSVLFDINTLQHGSQNSLPWSRYGLERAQSQLHNLAPDFDHVRQTLPLVTGENFAIEVNGTTYTDRKAAAKALVDLMNSLAKNPLTRDVWKRLGYYGSYEIKVNMGDRFINDARLSSRNEDYTLRLVRDEKKIIERVEEAFSGVLQVESWAHRDVELYTRKIEEFNAELQRKQTQFAELRSRIADLDAIKRELEVALGIEQQSADLEEAMIGGDDE